MRRGRWLAARPTILEVEEKLSANLRNIGDVMEKLNAQTLNFKTEGCDVLLKDLCEDLACLSNKFDAQSLIATSAKIWEALSAYMNQGIDFAKADSQFLSDWIVPVGTLLQAYSVAFPLRNEVGVWTEAVTELKQDSCLKSCKRDLIEALTECAEAFDMDVITKVHFIAMKLEGSALGADIENNASSMLSRHLRKGLWTQPLPTT